MVALDRLAALVEPVKPEIYLPFENIARRRIELRDEEDWPIVAAALAFDCPIWTEDADLFGCGVAARTTVGIELFLTAASEAV